MTKENGKKIAEGLFEGGSPSPTLRHNAAMALTNTGIAATVAPGQWYTLHRARLELSINCSGNSPVAPLMRAPLRPRPRCRRMVSAVKMPGPTALVANLVSQIIPKCESLPNGVMNIFTENPATEETRFWWPRRMCKSLVTRGAAGVGRIIAAVDG